MNIPMLKTVKGCIALSLLVALQLSAFPVSYQRFIRPDGRRIDVIGDMHLQLPPASAALQEEKFCNAIRAIAAQGACTVLTEGSDDLFCKEDEAQDLFKDIPDASIGYSSNTFLSSVRKRMAQELPNGTVRSIEIRPAVLRAIVIMASIGRNRQAAERLLTDKNDHIRSLQEAIKVYRAASPEMKESQFPFFQEIASEANESIALDKYLKCAKWYAQAWRRVEDFAFSKITYALQQKPLKEHLDEMGERLEFAKRLLKDNFFGIPFAQGYSTQELNKTGEQYVAYLAEQDEQEKILKFGKIEDWAFSRPFDIHALAHVLAEKTNVVLCVGEFHAQTVSGCLEKLRFEKSGVNGPNLSVIDEELTLGDAHADRIYEAMEQ